MKDQLTGVTTEAFEQGYSLAQRLAVVGLRGTGLLFRISEYYDFEEAQLRMGLRGRLWLIAVIGREGPTNSLCSSRTPTIIYWTK